MGHLHETKRSIGEKRNIKEIDATTRSAATHFLVTVHLKAFQSLTSLHQILHLGLHLADKQPRHRELLFEFTVALRWSNLEFEITINYEIT